MRRCLLAHFIFLIMATVAGVAMSQSLGVIGETFQVEEMSFLDFIAMRLAEPHVLSKLTADAKEIGFKTYQYAKHPPSLHLPRAFKTETHVYIPQVTLHSDIMDAKGNILWKKGTTINALHELPSYQPHWLFLDGEDVAQVKWLKKALKANSKIILTGGSVDEVSKTLSRDVYFDQGGRISNQLGINTIPIVVTRDTLKDILIVHEVAINQEGDVIGEDGAS